MSNIRVDVSYTIQDGSEIVFRSPVDCSAVTGLIVYYPGADGSTASKVFALADAHGSNVGDIDHLFAENVVVKVILDVTESMAFVQNADTNAYLEIKFAEANQTAMDAQTAAGNAHAAANNAQTVANSANTAARNAQTSADNAQTAIDNHIADKENPHGVTAAQVGATTMTLLWENASPTSNFASQTISMDLSEYDAIMLLTRRSTSVHDIGFGISVLGHRGFAQNLALYTEVSAGVFICGREFTPSASGIVIGGGVYKFSNLAMSACNFDDAYAIPYRIYGIKGVTE